MSKQTIPVPKIDPRYRRHLYDEKYRKKHPRRAAFKESIQTFFGQQPNQLPEGTGSDGESMPAYYGVYGPERRSVYGPVNWDQFYPWSQVGKEYKDLPFSALTPPLSKKCIKFLKNHGFKFDKRLGKGALGEVWKVHRLIRVQNNEGEHEEKQYFAVKVLKLRKFQKKRRTVRQAVEKLMSEAIIHSKLDHENIIQREEIIHYYDEKSGFPQPIFICIFMELCKGNLYSLRFEKRSQTLTERQCHVWFPQIARGLAYLHSRRVSHLDIKPENILYKGDNWNNYVFKLADFGISKMFAPNELQVFNEDVGTAHFIAPEVHGDEEYQTKPVDVYSLGVTLIECFSGRRYGLPDVFRSLHTELYASNSHRIFDISDSLAHLMTNMTRLHWFQRLTIGMIVKHPWVRNPL